MSDVTDLDDLPDCVNDINNCFTFAASSIDRAQLSDIDTDLELTLSERYFLGGLGAFQVRGFKQRSLGPRRTILQRVPILDGASSPTGEILFVPFNRNSNVPRDDPDRCWDPITGCWSPPGSWREERSSCWPT